MRFSGLSEAERFLGSGWFSVLTSESPRTPTDVDMLARCGFAGDGHVNRQYMGSFPIMVPCGSSV